MDYLKEAMDQGMNAHVDTGSTLETVQTRISENISSLVKRQAQVFKTDENFLSRGQYIRFTKQQLLRAIYFKSESIFYCASQFLSVMREFIPTDSSHCFHLLCMGNLFGQVITEVADDTATFYQLCTQEAVILKNQQKKK